MIHKFSKLGINRKGAVLKFEAVHGYFIPEKSGHWVGLAVVTLGHVISIGSMTVFKTNPI